MRATSLISYLIEDFSKLIQTAFRWFFFAEDFDYIKIDVE